MNWRGGGQQLTLIGIILTWLLYLVLRAFDHQRLSVKFSVAAIGAIPVAAAIAWANYYVFYLYEAQGYFDDSILRDHIDEVREAVGKAPWPEMIDNAIVRYFSILAWAAMYLAIGYAREIREAERTASRYAQAAQDAELRSLRYQVNPHFLFNTLNSLSSLVIKGEKDKAEEMIQNLSTFYRTSLSSDPLEEVTLTEEVEFQKQYLAIEKIRFPRTAAHRNPVAGRTGKCPRPGIDSPASCRKRNQIWCIAFDPPGHHPHQRRMRKRPFSAARLRRW